MATTTFGLALPLSSKRLKRRLSLVIALSTRAITAAGAPSRRFFKLTTLGRWQ